MSKSALKDIYFLILVACAVVFVAFWSWYGYMLYSTFSVGYYDTGVEAYSMYWHIHGLQYYTYPLDYLVFTDHISIFSLLLVPLYALYQVPITLYEFEYLVLAVTSLLIYYITNELLGSRKIGFALGLAFLVNPGTLGLTMDSFHLESLIPLFYILAFYSFMRNRSSLFILSIVLLLSLMEVMPIVGATLVFGLYIYEKWYARKVEKISNAVHSQRLKLLVAGFALSIAFALFYHVATTSIISSYSNISASSLVPIQRLKDYVSEQIAVLTGSQHVVIPNVPQYIFYLVLGLAFVFLGFGLGMLVNMPIAVVLCLPWLIDAVIERNAAVVSPVGEYYAFALGGAVVSAIIGYMLLRYKVVKLIFLKNPKTRNYESYFASSIIFSSLMISLFVLLVATLQSIANPFLNYGINYTQINNALATIPSNATVMAQSSLSTHLFRVHQLELYPTQAPFWFTGNLNLTLFWTKPEYIVIDTRMDDYAALNETNDSIYYYMSQNYTTLYNQSGLYIFRLKNST